MFTPSLLTVDKKKEKEKDLTSYEEKMLYLVTTGGYKTVFLYVSKNDEPDTFALIQRLLQEKKRVILSCCKKETKELLPIEIKSLKELREGEYGIQEPKFIDQNNIFPKKKIDLFFVPGTAFDEHGNRKGHGLGYFDRFLKDVKGQKLIVGITFEKNLHKSIPTNSWDIPMDMIITEKRVIRI